MAIGGYGTTEKLRRLHKTGGLPMLAGRIVDSVIFSSPTPGLIQRAYSSVSPSVYRAAKHDVNEYGDIDPYRVYQVNPTDITEFSRRPWPLWKGMSFDFGRVRGGDWDIRDTPEISPEYSRKAFDLHYADTFEESVLFRSLESRFVEGVDWSETPIVQRATELIDQDIPAWQQSESRKDIKDRCAEIDRLYESIQEEGVLSQAELQRRGHVPQTDFIKRKKNEVLCDIGRDGQLLFVNGRHRLAIAKILDLNQVPISILVRHEKYMND